jgi:CheY-like chemotaxis protein
MVNAAEKRLSCPKCGWSNVRLSERSGFLDGLAALVFLSPLRCRSCRRRFYRLRFTARRALSVATADHPTPAAVDVPKPIPAPAPVVRRKIILLLDDDPALRRLLGRLLGREGYEVREASDAGAAVAELGCAGIHLEIDLAIVNLSDRDEGDEAVKALRSAHPELPVIVLSETLGPVEASEKLLILPKPSRVFAVVEGVRDLMSRDPIDAR